LPLENKIHDNDGNSRNAHACGDEADVLVHLAFPNYPLASSGYATHALSLPKGKSFH
jgi:hypothetical protein